MSGPREIPIAKIARALSKAYGDPRHGNKRNPLDELVYIILSTRTQSGTYQQTYRDLKRAFPSWNSITKRQRRRTQRILRPNGMSELKSGQLVAIMEILRNRFGKATLRSLKRMTDREAEEFLISLPGVSRKVAKCVLMYSLDRQVLPVDVHVHRLATRLGLRTKKRPDTSQEPIERAVPPRYRYGFHVNAVAHGRAVCLPRVPKCDKCQIVNLCARKGLVDCDE